MGAISEIQIWSLVFGSFFFMASAFSTNQGTYQWFLAVPTRRHGQKYAYKNKKKTLHWKHPMIHFKIPLINFKFRALMLSVAVIACFYFLCCFTGLVAYSKYADCDPIEGKVLVQILKIYIF